MLLWPLLLLRVCLPPEWILPRTRGSSAIHFSLSFSGAQSCLDWLGFGARELGSWVAGEVERCSWWATQARLSSRAGQASVHLSTCSCPTPVLHLLLLLVASSTAGLCFSCPPVCLSYKFTYAYLSWKWARALAQARDEPRRSPEGNMLTSFRSDVFILRWQAHAAYAQ